MRLTDARNIGRISPLTNKLEFVRKATEAGIKAVPVIAMVKDGRIAFQTGELPEADLFIKPQAGKGGRGAEVWQYDDGGHRFRKLGSERTVRFERFLEFIASEAVKEPLLIQPRLFAHPDVADLGLSAVPTCRLVTLTNERGDGEPVMAVFRMPAVDGKVVDNFHAGGIAAPIDIKSGQLGSATNLALAPTDRHEQHPATGAQISGRKLPFWSEILDLAAQAHACFAPRVIVGWDICITPSGPILIEGNSAPCVDVLQRPHDQPLGAHRFGELLAYHLRRKTRRASRQK